MIPVRCRKRFRAEAKCVCFDTVFTLCVLFRVYETAGTRYTKFKLYVNKALKLNALHESVYDAFLLSVSKQSQCRG